jgi:hypothetical protein
MATTFIGNHPDRHKTCHNILWFLKRCGSTSRGVPIMPMWGMSVKVNFGRFRRHLGGLFVATVPTRKPSKVTGEKKASFVGQRPYPKALPSGSGR